MQHHQKTILDVLLERNRITDSEAAGFALDADNYQIEEKLRRDGIVGSEDIAKAYAILYDLPVIRLENYDIKPDILGLIPKEVAQRFQVIIFAVEGAIPGGKVKMALGSPARLKDTPPAIVNELKEKKQVSVEIYITTPEDINSAVKRYDQINEATESPVAPIPIAAEVKKIENNIVPTAGAVKTVDLKSLNIPYEVISKFPVEISQKYNMVVFENPSPELIKVAVSNPDDKKVQEILDFVKQKNEIAIEEYVASPPEIAEAIKLYYRKPVETSAPVTPQAIPSQKENKPGIINPSNVAQKFASAFHSNAGTVTPVKTEEAPTPKPQFVRRPEAQTTQPSVATITATDNSEAPENVKVPESDLDKFLGRQINDIEALKQIAQTGSVPQILAATVALAAFKKASDIHIEPEETNLRIRFRIDGVLKDIIKMPLELQPAIISRIKILSRLKIDEQRVPQDGRFDVLTQGHEIDLRVSTLPTVRGEKAALRLLDKTKSIYSFEELGITGKNLELLEENVKKPFGVILATGPTGSGKSTTLYSILQKISSPAINVITLEDPVEYEIPGVNQCQVKPKIGFSFAEGLRSVLRQDPNIIMVGEIRDAETAGMATHAALTGHLVLTTLHTNDAAGALPRLINMGIEPFLITSSINVIIGQRLVRKICPKCKRELQIPEALKADIDKELERFNLPKPYKFYEGAGCTECNQGYSGRIGIYEVLTMSEEIENLAIKKRPSSELLAAAVEQGMVTMKQDGLLKALNAVTTISEVLRVTTSG